MNKTTKIIIQARTGSTRLPNKMIIPFYKNKGLFEVIVDELLNDFLPEQLVLATTTLPNDDILATIAEEKQIGIFRGSENNVLNRFIDAAQKFNAQQIIRVCADNPFLQNQYIKSLLTEAEPQVDYISYTFPDGTPTIKSHIGMFAEYVTLNALKNVNHLTQNEFYQEHVTNYIYSHSENFSLKFLELPSFLQDKKHIRLTIDTENDFKLMQELYTWYKSNQNIDVKSLILKIEQSEALKAKMLKEIQRNEK